MAGGSALLALAGPVGWTVGGAALLGSGIYLNSRNKRHAREATEKRAEVQAQVLSLKAANREIAGIQRRVKPHAEGCLDELRRLKSHAPNDYQRFSQEQKLRLAALVNHARSLGALLNKEVGA